jgi:hypothetical protein
LDLFGQSLPHYVFKIKKKLIFHVGDIDTIVNLNRHNLFFNLENTIISFSTIKHDFFQLANKQTNITTSNFHHFDLGHKTMGCILNLLRGQSTGHSLLTF